jgi:hypothetical protein
MRRRRHPAHGKPQPDLPGGQWPDVTSAADMDAAIGSGQAANLSQVITFVRHYRSTWWLSTEIGWLPIPYPVAFALDQHAERMQDPAVKNAANHFAIRAVIELAREAASPDRPDYGR